jgi:hypothetical protein
MPLLGVVMELIISPSSRLEGSENVEVGCKELEMGQFQPSL